MGSRYKLSKSSYLKGKQCLKALFLSKKFPELQDPIPEGRQAIFDQGYAVGVLAQELFPGGVPGARDLPRDFMSSFGRTLELIDNGIETIYEAGFRYKNTHCFVDILVKDGPGWKAYEVKSSTEVKEIHQYDAAFQYRILANSGLKISDYSIIHINNQYNRMGALNIRELFRIESVLDEVVNLQAEVVQLIGIETAILASDSVPETDIGPHCFDPYECEFRGHCWQHIPDYSVFDVSGLHFPKKMDLYARGILKTTDIPDTFPLNDKQQLQVLADRTNQTTIDRAGILEFLKSLEYPLHFLDFETINPAIPLYDHSRPYQQIVFQYSLHYLESGAGTLQHKDYLGDPEIDPRTPLMEKLLDDLGDAGSIVVYNKGFETGRLREIARDFPAFSSAIEGILARIRDLMIPFQQKHFYAPAMKGSYSIKDVLPALVPDFSYAGLEINKGDLASAAYLALLKENDPQRTVEVRNNLLEYCKMDTLAMVKILEVLKNL